MRLAVLIALFLFALHARGECVGPTDANGDASGPVTCDAATFNALVHTEQDERHDRDVALAANERLSKELAARLAQLDAVQSPPPWPWLAAGAGVGFVVAVVVVVLVR